MGRPTLYTDSHPERAFELALLGLTLAQMAKAFGIAERTMDDWVATHDELADAIENGGAFADARVARSLYKRAVGYDYTRTVTYRNKDGEVTQTVESTEHIPPESQAALKWLNNRQPDTWRHAKTAADGDDDALPAPATVVIEVKSARLRADPD